MSKSILKLVMTSFVCIVGFILLVPVIGSPNTQYENEGITDTWKGTYLLELSHSINGDTFCSGWVRNSIELHITQKGTKIYGEMYFGDNKEEEAGIEINNAPLDCMEPMGLIGSSNVEGIINVGGNVMFTHFYNFPEFMATISENTMQANFEETYLSEEDGLIILKGQRQPIIGQIETVKNMQFTLQKIGNEESTNTSELPPNGQVTILGTGAPSGFACPNTLDDTLPINPGIPSESLCRGACGKDCPSTCEVSYEMRYYTEANCEYIVKTCGSHIGCRVHDNCYDACAGEFLPYLCEKVCDYKAFKSFPFYCIRWMQGKGPYDSWIQFSELIRTYPKKLD